MENPIEKLIEGAAEKALVKLEAALSQASSAAIDGALKQAPILDALLSGEEVTLTIQLKRKA